PSLRSSDLHVNGPGVGVFETVYARAGGDVGGFWPVGGRISQVVLVSLGGQEAVSSGLLLYEFTRSCPVSFAISCMMRSVVSRRMGRPCLGPSFSTWTGSPTRISNFRGRIMLLPGGWSLSVSTNPTGTTGAPVVNANQPTPVRPR